jgi:2-dehydro-3-deoxygluconokinase
MGKTAVTFGEIMLRLQPPNFLRFVQATSFEAVYGGGEANVAVSLSNYGINARFVTKLPKNPIGDACLNELRRYGVDTSYIVRGGDRLGIYFCEKGASQRPSNVVYDRANSSIATAVKDDFDFKKIFEGASWFHFTGITPALSDNMADTVLAALKCAKEMGLTVSCDLNYRKKLWSRKKACEVMTQMMPYIDVLIANEEDAHDVFGISAPDSDISGGRLSVSGYEWVAKEIIKRFKIKKVAITMRESISASVNGWSAMLCNGSETFDSKKYTINIVDRVGGGDSFGGGLIYSYLNGGDDKTALEFAVAASCLKHTIEGDCNMVTVSEVNALMGGDSSGRVKR